MSRTLFRNGEISSAVFKDKQGLPVERAGNRPENEVIEYGHDGIWINNYFDKIINQSRPLRRNDRESVIKFAESIGSRAYNDIMFGESGNGQRKSSEKNKSDKGRMLESDTN